ncbi:hypothetical protein TKK_0004073 [Trichogramma kaykai]|uniref:Timeless C-terminal domain-containing protein n=1 Tax=Trichogramma kaykai TaxID=54128 RepID=A0ABD2XKM3_9HYME
MVVAARISRRRSSEGEVPDEEFQLHVEPSTQNEEKNKDDDEDEENSDDTDEEEEAAESRFEESSFDFMDFMRRFCNVRVVMNLTLLFQTFDKNTPELNHYVLKMFYRIAHDCKMPGMIYQASIFRVLQRVFASDKREHKDLAAFGRFVIRGFAQVAQRNPKAYMELLFWKGTKQATEMTDGYDCEHATGGKKSKKNAWTDAEEDELRTLFMEHETQKIPRDLIEYIMENLINQDRTRRGVIKKLKELHLIVNSKGVRAEVAKRLPKEWSQDEIAHLTTLVEQMRNEDGSFECEDPLQDLHDGLIIKRPKSKIKEKLLQLGLVDDPKQLRKRRKKKSDGPKSSWETRSASESGSSSDSSDSDASGTSDNDADRPKKRKEKSKSKSKWPTYVYTDAQLSGLLKDVIAKDMKEALVWLKENLEESLEDRDEEDMEGTALVPISQDVAEILDSASFQRFMRAAGIEEPGPEESYWRIPVSLLPATIKRRCELIEAALRGEFMEEPVVASRRVESDDEDDVFERLRNYSNKQNEAAAAAAAAGGSPSSPQQSNRDNRSRSPNPEQSSMQKSRTPGTSRKKTPRSTKRSKKKTPAGPRTFGESSDSDGGDAPSSSRNSQENRDLNSDKENDVNGRGFSDEEQQSTSTQARNMAQKSKSKVKSVKTFLDSDTSDEDEGVDTVAEKSSQAQGSINKSKSILNFDADDSEKMEIQNEAKTMSQSANEKSTNSSRHRINLPSESEEDEEVPQNIDDASTEAKRIRSDNSDSETPLQKKRRILESDEDEEEEKSSTAISKKTALVLSDDED